MTSNIKLTISASLWFTHSCRLIDKPQFVNLDGFVNIISKICLMFFVFFKKKFSFLKLVGTNTLNVSTGSSPAAGR